MALPLWGELEKAQDDSTKIEAFIDAKIIEHENDPEAHLGEGESLEMHKKEEVIDHPAGSILPDKVSFSDFDFSSDFSNLTPWTKVGAVSNASWPGVFLEVDDGGTETSSIRSNLDGILSVGTMSYDFLFDTFLYVDFGEGDALFRVGITNVTFSTWYLGFKIVANEIYGFVRLGGSETSTPALHTVSSAELVFLRAYLDIEANLLRFYVQGVEVATIDVSAGVSISNEFGCKADANGDSGTIFRIYGLRLTRSVL